MFPTLTLLSCCAVVCLQQDPTPPPGADVVRLKVGTELSGRITAQTDDHVFVEVAPGSVVGFSMDQVESIARAASAHRDATAAPAAPDWFRDRDQWFALHDARGHGVGQLHETARRDEEGRIRLGEEWRFSAGGRITELTRLEVCAPDGSPLSAFCHERTLDSDSRTLSERIVRAVLEDGQVVVTTQTPRGDERKTAVAAKSLRWPLEVRATLRATPAGAQARSTHEVYDAVTDSARETTWDVGRMRRVPGARGDAVRVRVISSPDGEEWLDAAGSTVRREVNGPALVAVPTTEADARRATVKDGFPAAIRAEPGGRFAMWLPNPAWSFVDGDTGGQITARDRCEKAAVSLVRFEHLDPALALQSATDAVARWLELVQPDMRISAREQTTLRDQPAMAIRADFVAKDAGGAPLAFSCVTYVLKVDGNWFAACGSAPRGVFAQISDDIAWIASHFEFDAKGFDPQVSGPLLKSNRATVR